MTRLYVLIPCVFNLYVKYIMGNARLDESQARIKIAKRKKKRLPREISTISDMQMIPLYGRK